MIKITYDHNADAAYLFLDGFEAEVKRTYPCDPIEVKGMINLDFDGDGRLVGIEVLDASKKLPKGILEMAQQIGRKHNI